MSEEFWRGEFGADYLKRNVVEPDTRVPFWRSALEFTGAKSVLEVGCSRGHNLKAIQSIDKAIECHGVDVNEEAAKEAGAQVGAARDIVRLFGAQSHDLVFTSGVLIHIPPHELRQTMQAIVDTSKRFVLAVEYEAEKETEVEYRGHKGKLWKRPFGELYHQMGLKLLWFGDAQGFNDCTGWLFQKDMNHITTALVQAELAAEGWELRG